MTDCRLDCHASSPDRILRALSHADRRAVLDALAADGAECTAIETLAERVDAVPKTELYHRHLPVLADAGLVSFDSERERVEYTATEAATAILEVVDEHFG